ncbi:Uncharacterised protein [Mycobacterium tuberculosis]|nr:Uncharacterised protein [Mycobacterium tuberculosis]
MPPTIKAAEITASMGGDNRVPKTMFINRLRT